MVVGQGKLDVRLDCRAVAVRQPYGVLKVQCRAVAKKQRRAAAMRQPYVVYDFVENYSSS